MIVIKLDNIEHLLKHKVRKFLISIKKFKEIFLITRIKFIHKIFYYMEAIDKYLLKIFLQ